MSNSELIAMNSSTLQDTPDITSNANGSSSPKLRPKRTDEQRQHFAKVHSGRLVLGPNAVSGEDNSFFRGRMTDFEERFSRSGLEDEDFRDLVNEGATTTFDLQSQDEEIPGKIQSRLELWFQCRFDEEKGCNTHYYHINVHAWHEGHPVAMLASSISMDSEEPCAAISELADGQYGVRLEDQNLWVEYIEIEKGYQGLGIGRAVVEFLFWKARSIGIKKVACAPISLNKDGQLPDGRDRALIFWEAMGLKRSTFSAGVFSRDISPMQRASALVQTYRCPRVPKFLANDPTSVDDLEAHLAMAQNTIPVPTTQAVTQDVEWPQPEKDKPAEPAKQPGKNAKKNAAKKSALKKRKQAARATPPEITISIHPTDSLVNDLGYITSILVEATFNDKRVGRLSSHAGMFSSRTHARRAQILQEDGTKKNNMENGRAVITLISVEWDWLRQGIARKMVEMFFAHIKGHGISTVYVQPVSYGYDDGVLPDGRDRAVVFWEGMGFRRVRNELNLNLFRISLSPSPPHAAGGQQNDQTINPTGLLQNSESDFSEEEVEEASTFLERFS